MTTTILQTCAGEFTIRLTAPDGIEVLAHRLAPGDRGERASASIRACGLDWLILLRSDGTASLAGAPVKSPPRGAGDLISAVTERLGLPECPGCGRRAEALNGWLPTRARRA